MTAYENATLPDFTKIQNNEYLISLEKESIPNFIIINCKEFYIEIDSETQLYSSIIVFLTKRLEIKTGAIVKATINIKAKEIKKQDFICGIMGASHVGFGFFGSNIYYLNCIDDFFEKYYSLIKKNNGNEITIGEPPFFYRTNQYNNHIIYSEMGGVVYANSTELNRIEGEIDVSGAEGGYTNDIMFGTTAGGTVYIESDKIYIHGRDYLLNVICQVLSI
jgi:hypothetical protein